MNKLEQAARQALEALEESCYPRLSAKHTDRYEEAITALQEALAEQAEQERKYGELAGTHNWTPPNYTDEQWQKLDQEYQDHVAEQAEQEPVAWAVYNIQYGGSKSLHWNEEHCKEGDATKFKAIPLYAAPVRTKDLTDNEMEELCRKYARFELIREAIAAYKEKNK